MVGVAPLQGFMTLFGLRTQGCRVVPLQGLGSRIESGEKWGMVVRSAELRFFAVLRMTGGRGPSGCVVGCPVARRERRG